MFTPVLFFAAYIWAATGTDETLHAYGAADRIWRLSEMNGAPFDGDVTISFPRAGVVMGQGPCNRYNGALTLPYPWFGIGPLAATRMACPDLPLETAYFATLESVTISEVREHSLILSTEDEVVLVFTSGD